MMRLLLLVLLALAPLAASAQTHAPLTLEARVARLESRVDRASAAGVVAFVCGAFCALWAQNTRRNAWLWFFLGLLFSVITLVFLLNKNADDLAKRPRDGRKPFDLQDFRQQ